MRVKYAVLGAPKDLIVRCLFKCQLFLQIWNKLFCVYRTHGIFQGPALETVFCAIFVKVYQIETF